MLFPSVGGTQVSTQPLPYHSSRTAAIPEHYNAEPSPYLRIVQTTPAIGNAAEGGGGQAWLK